MLIDEVEGADSGGGERLEKPQERKGHLRKVAYSGLTNILFYTLL